MHRRPRSLLLVMLAACAPQRAYEPPTTAAAVIRPKHAPPRRAAAAPKTPAPQVQRPPHEMSTAKATAAVLGAELALPMVAVLPPTPETETLSRVLPPVGRTGDLPGTLTVIGTLRALGGIALPTLGAPGPATPMPRGFPLWWIFPFFPFGLSKAGTP